MVDLRARRPRQRWLTVPPAFPQVMSTLSRPPKKSRLSSSRSIRRSSVAPRGKRGGRRCGRRGRRAVARRRRAGGEQLELDGEAGVPRAGAARAAEWAAGVARQRLGRRPHPTSWKGDEERSADERKSTKKYLRGDAPA